ncbi:MAG: hypothetical protein HC915_10750 [Anaerolineae bacterium]|nr:hypothetical protein [Anaerolineae bacterium]
MQRFIKLEVDLDNELARRSYTSPLLSTTRVSPADPDEGDRQRRATVASQDEAAMMAMEIYPQNNWSSVDFSFSIMSMLALRFRLPHLDEEERRTFVTLLRRDVGMTFLWTPERWEQDYLIFVNQGVFTRVYAFSQTAEATARLTNEALGTLTDWLERGWFPRRRRRRSSQVVTPQAPPPAPEPPPGNPADSDKVKRIVQRLESGNLGKPENPGGADDPFTW